MAAPKGNKNAVGNNGGRPPIHTDPKEVERLIDDYYNWIEGESETREREVISKDEKGLIVKTTEKYETWVRRPEPPTVTGLSLHLGFCSKTSLYEYADKIEFMHPIKRAVSRIEKHHEIAIAHGDKCTGNIFALKNFGWKDRTEIDHNIKTEQPLFGE